MASRGKIFRRPDAGDRTRRDIQRFRRRQSGARFWQSLGLIGSVGWPIVVLATGGALVGHYLDARFGAGIRFTLILLVSGTILGCAIAFRALREDGS